MLLYKGGCRMNIMTKRGSLDNVITYEHFCVTKADLINIPKSQITLGSVAIVLQDENDSMGIYIAGSDKQWNEISTSINGGGNTVSLDFIHICSQSEYDSQTLEPTIELPEENIFYLVPNNGINEDLFDEWIYINGNWEKFGVGKVGAQGPKGDTYTLTNADKDDIATLVLNQLSIATGVSF